MSWAVALVGWTLAVLLFGRLRRRLSLVADAEHELRGAATVIALAVERLPATRSAPLLRLQVERMRAGLADLRGALGPGGAGLHDPQLDAGRLAQVLGNLVANAAEHGVGEVEVRSTREADRVRVEIRNRNRPKELDGVVAGRGRGLTIAARAARSLGGRVRVDARDGVTVAMAELPASGQPATDASRAA